MLIGLYVRVSLHETPVFAKVAKAGKQVKVPLGTLLSKHLKATILGTFIMLATYTLFYLMTVYSMTYGTTPQPLGLGYSRNSFLWMLMVAVIGFGVMVPIAGLLADAFGRRKTMIAITLLMIGFAFLFPTLLGSGNRAGDGLPAVRPEHHGADLWPHGRAAAGLFPTEVRYTGASFSYNVASILGASVAPYIATGWRPTTGCSTSACTGGDGRADAVGPAADERNPPPVAVIPYGPLTAGPHALFVSCHKTGLCWTFLSVTGLADVSASWGICLRCAAGGSRHRALLRVEARPSRCAVAHRQPAMSAQSAGA